MQATRNDSKQPAIWFNVLPSGRKFLPSGRKFLPSGRKFLPSGRKSYNSSHSVWITSVNLKLNSKQCKQPEMTVSNQQYDLMYCPLGMLSAFLLAIGMLCIYLTLNLELPGLPSGRNSYPSGRNSYPSGRNSYPSGRKMLQHAMDFVRSEQLYQSLPQDKYRLIPLASVQLSIKLILSLSLVS